MQKKPDKQTTNEATGNMTDFPLYLYHHGKNDRIYELFGAHREVRDGEEGYIFRVWAPHARSVSVVGDFNGWNVNENVMYRMVDGESFELFIPGVKQYDTYKYCITAADGRQLMKADPVGFHTETPPATASKLYELDGYEWKDKEYFEKIGKRNIFASPMNIYEVNLLSWRRHDDGNYYSYQDLARELVPYVKGMGYTHVEFMPVTEFPFEGSWGYQVTGYYAVTSRMGTPKDFMALIDAFHTPLRRHNVDVIDTAHSLDGYDVLISPFFYTADEHGLPARVRAWVEQGGTWIVGPMTDIMTDYASKYKEAPHSFLEELAGVYELYDLPVGNDVYRAQWADGGEFGLSVCYAAYELRGAEALAVYANGEFKGLPAVTCNRVGKGRVIVLGSVPSPEALLRLIGKEAVADASDNVALVARSGAENGIIAVETEGKEGILTLHGVYTELLGERACTGTVALKPYEVLVLKK